MTQFSSLYSARLDRELGSADSTQLFTTARRKAAINEGVQQFADLTECYRRALTVTWPSKQHTLDLSTYAGSTDFVRFDAEGAILTYTDSAGTAIVVGGDDLPRVDRTWLTRYDPQWQTSTVSTGTLQLPSKQYAEMDGGSYRLGFTPVPSAGSTAASLSVRVSYIARPPALSNDTDEPFTDASSVVRVDLRIYHQAVVHYAAAQLEKFRRDTQASTEQMQAFLAYVERFKASAKRKGGQALALATNYFRSRR
jgi:hypothetical protein